MELAWYVKTFITLLVVVDPIGSVPVFLHATASVPAKLHRAFAVRGVLIAACVLMFFLVLGQLLIEALGLQMGSFQVAGGIILFLFALQMILGESKPTTEISESKLDTGAHLQGAAFPLAMPSIASPGAILAIVVLTDNHLVEISEQAIIAALLLGVLVLTLGLLLMAGRIIDVIGATGAIVVSRVSGLILATIALDSVFVGLDQLGVITLKAL